MSDDSKVELGMLLGHQEAFGAIAGRCSAAQAASIRRLREEKLYKEVEDSWGAFSTRYLKMHRTNADQIIRLLDDFGPQYFEISQLTRISPETYRAIAPALHDGAIEYNGETIELNQENAQKVALAVAALRKTAAPKPPPEVSVRLQSIEARCVALADELRGIARKERHTENWITAAGVISRTRGRFELLDVENCG